MGIDSSHHQKKLFSKHIKCLESLLSAFVRRARFLVNPEAGQYPACEVSYWPLLGSEGSQVGWFRV